MSILLKIESMNRLINVFENSLTTKTFTPVMKVQYFIYKVNLIHHQTHY